MSKEDLYRQTIVDLGLSIERSTEKVPDDGRYYVLREYEVLGVFRTLKKAQALFKQLVSESGYQPKKQNSLGKSASELAIEHYMETKELYWASSYKFRGRGGKGGRGGI